MATRRKALPVRPPARKAKAKAKRPAKPALVLAVPIPEDETPQQAITAIAQDAVLILRRGLAWRAALAARMPGRISMSDCIALLRLTADLSEAARKGTDGQAPADYSRLSPEELAQYAALSLKVDYA